MKHKMALVIIFIIIIFSITIAILILTLPTSKYSIIKKFKDNKELFEQSIKELSNEENIYFDRVVNAILIDIHQKLENKVNIIRVKESDFYKYEQTINLMQNLDVEQISKSGENIDFLFYSSLREGRSISYVTDWEDYFESGYIWIERQQISGNWYYVVKKGL